MFYSRLYSHNFRMNWSRINSLGAQNWLRGVLNMLAPGILFLIIGVVIVWLLQALFGWMNAIPYPLNYVYAIIVVVIFVIIGTYAAHFVGKFKPFKA